MSCRGSVYTVPCGYDYGLGFDESCGLVSGSGVSFGTGVGYGAAVCSSQLPGSEVVIRPAPSVVSLPGPILSSSGNPVAVGQVVPYGYPALGSAGGFSAGSISGGYGRLGYSGVYGSGYGGGYTGGYCGGYGGWRRYSRRCLPSYCSGSWGPC